MDVLENGPFTTIFDQLIRAGAHLPAPETLDDGRVHGVLWGVIRALADLRVFIESTDHLSDRELYAQLWHDTLREEVADVEPDESACCHVDLLGGWSEGDTQVFLRYYADDEWRERWRADFPDLHIPPREEPPYDRDRHLPKPYGW